MFARRRLAVVSNVLTPSDAAALQQEAAELRSIAQDGASLRFVHSGRLLARKSLFVRFMQAPALTALVNAVIDAPQPLGVCPGAPDDTYSLSKNDFGCKVNYYEGDKRGIGWHYDKETSWMENEILKAI